LTKVSTAALSKQIQKIGSPSAMHIVRQVSKLSHALMMMMAARLSGSLAPGDSVVDEQPQRRQTGQWVAIDQTQADEGHP
jgi:hypothetical protein